ncbi:MAG: hypothetical protein HQL72_02215 [Magnetococcales bacterium]|nr:hypothetical protein [Magnetococcales bacterium]
MKTSAQKLLTQIYHADLSAVPEATGVKMSTVNLVLNGNAKDRIKPFTINLIKQRITEALHRMHCPLTHTQIWEEDPIEKLKGLAGQKVA